MLLLSQPALSCFKQTSHVLLALTVSVAASLLVVVPSPAYATGDTASDSANSPERQFRVARTDGEALRMRAAPSLRAPIVGRLPEGTVVTISEGVATQADGERWLPLRLGEQRGWAAARYLVREVAQKVSVRQLPRDAPLGERVAALAERQVGQPYVWGGSAPGGFDCSGLVQWAYAQVGLRLSRSLPEQLGSGRAVDAAALRPGDLVFFENTYQTGLSHDGIYVGKGRFVHAADEARGVTVSDMGDEYWRSRFVRAVRPRP